MTPQTITLLAGILFFFIAIVGGRIVAKGFNIPEVPAWGRLVLAIAGLGLIVVYFLGTVFSLFPDNGATPRQDHACRRQKDLPAVTEGNRSEAEIRSFLTSEGFLNIVAEPAFIPGAPHGVVVGQTPSPGTILCPRDLVTIKVTR
jgi:hypothetical protein